MKKTLLKSMTIFAGLFLATNVFANESMSTQSISDALQTRAEMLAPKATASQGFSDTYITVMNYDDPNGILVSFPTGTMKLSQRTAGRYMRSNYTGDTRVEIQNTYGVTFFAGYVNYHDMIEVYLVNGKYITRITH